MEKHTLRRARIPAVFIISLMLTGCESMDPAMMQNMMGDLRGGLGDLQNLRRSPSSVGDIRNKFDSAQRIFATVQRYAALTGAQRQRVEATVTRKYDGMVQKEKRQLAPTYAKRKAEVRQRAVIAKQKSPSSAARVEADAQKEVAKVDLEWEKAAKSSVAKKYDTDFAVPVQNSEGKTVVAFASVKNGGVSVSDSSYVVNGGSGSLKSDSKISHSGKSYAVLK